MAFFDEEIEKLSKRNPPKSLKDCLQTDKVSQRLWEWAQNIENWGRVILVLMLIVGVADTYFVWIGTSQLDELLYSAENSTRFLSTIGTALQWIFYAFIEYCVYHAIALLMCALASIVQSNRITSDLASYNAGLIQESMGISGQSVGKHFSVEDLGELAKKKAQGLISDTEYEAQRNEILKHL